MADFDFADLEIIDVPVTNLQGKNYIMREPSGDIVARFNNARAKCAKYQDGGISSVDGLGNMPIFLLSMCIFNVDEQGTIVPTQPIAMDILKKLPDRVIQSLYEEAKRIGEIDQEETDLEALKKQQTELTDKIVAMEEKEETVKNELNGMEIGSS